MLSAIPKLFFYLSSYFTDREIYTSQTKYNKQLKVVLSNGKYCLNSGKANYSFGNLHIAFQQVFAKTNLKEKSIKNALILGFGAGSIAHILQRELKSNCQITGVEIDAEVIHIAKTFFGLSELDNCQVIIKDARQFLEEDTNSYDLIAIDLFEEMDVPSTFCQASFLELLPSHLTSSAYLYFNFVSDTKQQKDEFLFLKKNFDQIFPDTINFEIMDSNHILFSKAKS
jgi:spermidine synthase